MTAILGMKIAHLGRRVDHIRLQCSNSSWTSDRHTYPRHRRRRLQFPVWRQPFSASINGTVNAALKRTLNSLVQTGPVVQFFSIGLDPASLDESNVLTLTIDNVGDGGDGWDVDFLTVGVQTTGPLNLLSVGSVKGEFSIDLPLTGPSGVEDRSGGPNKKYTVVMTFDQNIISVGSASSTCGSVQSIVIDSSDPHKVNLNLVNVAHACNGSTITVTADSITDDQGNVLDSASVGLGLLLGDVNADRVVNRSDTMRRRCTKGRRPSENFRNDVNANGHIEQADIALIRQQQGTSLP